MNSPKGRQSVRWLAVFPLLGHSPVPAAGTYPLLAKGKAGPGKCAPSPAMANHPLARAEPEGGTR